MLFHEYMADQREIMRRVYSKAGLELTRDVEEALRDYLKENPRNKYGKVIYDLEGDFAVGPEALRDRFKFYYDAFPVRMERSG